MQRECGLVNTFRQRSSFEVEYPEHRFVYRSSREVCIRAITSGERLFASVCPSAEAASGCTATVAKADCFRTWLTRTALRSVAIYKTLSHRVVRAHAQQITSFGLPHLRAMRTRCLSRVARRARARILICSRDQVAQYSQGHLCPRPTAVPRTSKALERRQGRVAHVKHSCYVRAVTFGRMIVKPR